MALISLNMYQAIAVAALMLVIGQVLVNNIGFLKRYCIPAPVVGGLIFAILHTVLRGMGIVEFTMDDTLQTVFMNAFFCSVGFLAAFGMLKKGGVGVIKFLPSCSGWTDGWAWRWVRSRWSADTAPRPPGAKHWRNWASREQRPWQWPARPTA